MQVSGDGAISVSACIEELNDEVKALREQNIRITEDRDRYAADSQMVRSELDLVYRSKKWRLVSWLARIADALFPHNSRRRRFISSRYRALRHRKHAQKQQIATQSESVAFKRNPLISIITPVYNVKEKYLVECIESVINQTYQNWELCIVDDASTMPHIRPILEKYAAAEKRIKVQFSEENGHIAVASNKALQMATGEYIGYLDNDDILCPEALLKCVEKINEIPSLEVLYTDNYMIDEADQILGKNYKPDWSPEAFQSTNYVIHFCLYSADLLRKVNGLCEERQYRGTQDTELKIRLLQYVKTLEHIPQCLYEWRIHSGSVSVHIDEKDYMVSNSIATFQLMLDQYYRHTDARIVMPVEAQNVGSGYFSVLFPRKMGKTAIIIPVQTQVVINKALIKQLEEVSAQTQICVYAACKYVLPIESDSSYSVISQDSKDICDAVRESRAENVLVLSNDINRVSLESMRNLIGYLSLSDEIGACGGKVLSKNKKILSGAYLMMNNLQIMHCGLDSAVAYQELCAQNCSAVSGKLMAVRADTFLKYDGFDFQTYGPLADVDFCLRMRKDGLRVVYNPRAVGFTEEPVENALLNLYTTKYYGRLKKKYADFWAHDPYYNRNYSQDFQFQQV